MGAAVCLAYVFALRVPSELLGQGHRSQFVCHADRICIARLRRKGQRQLTELVRSCTCSTNRLVCPHLWLDYVKQKVSGDRLFAMPSAFFHSQLWNLLAAVGIPKEVCPEYTSHAFRRGVAVDILERQGLSAMLQYGQWQSVRSVSRYASWDEMDRQMVGTLTAEASDEDN